MTDEAIDEKSDQPAGLPDRVRWQAFGVSVSVAALTILDLSKVNVGLPSIEASLNAGPTELQTVVAGYALAFGLSLVPSGRLGDLKSRRIMFIIGLIAFTLTSLLCALAPNAPLLIVGRFLQGIAAGIQMPQVLGLTQQLFQGKERGQAFGLFGAIIGLSTAFGPTIGGLLIAIGGDQDGWRLLFWMNVPLGIILLIAAIKLLPKKQRHESKVMDLDPIGLVLLGVTIVAFMLPFVLTTGAASDDPNRWWLLLLALASGSSFVFWERRYARRGRSPIVKFALFQLGSYRNGLLIATVYFAAIPSVFLLTTLYLQQGLDLEPVYAGMVTIPFALASAVTAWIGGRLVDRLGRTLVVIGLAVVLFGLTVVMILAVVTPAEASPWAMAAALTIAGLGAGFVISPNQTLTLQEIPVTEGGVAGSMAQLGQRVGTAMGLAAATSLFFSTLYAESSSGDQLGVYHDSYRNGVLVALALIAVALVLGLLDMRRRKKAAVA